MNRDELDALSQRMNDEIVSIYESADGWEWKWTPVWPANSPTLSWCGQSREEARAAYKTARAIWYRDAPHNGDY